MKDSSTKNNAIYKKGTQLSSFSIYTRNKAGNIRTIAPKESIYKRGCDDKYEQIQFIRNSLNELERISVFFFLQNIEIHLKSKDKISNVRDFKGMETLFKGII